MKTQTLKRTESTSQSLEDRGVSLQVLDESNRKTSDALISVLRNLISANENMYPGIDRWFSKKVLAGLRSGERKAYLAFQDEKPIAAAILKFGVSTKLCHLWINEEHREFSLGQLLLTQMTLDALDRAEEIHFTLPETLWASKKGFFRSFGFMRAKRTSLQYRKAEAELACSAPVSTVYSAVMKKVSGLLKRLSLSKFPGQPDLVMSVRPSFAEKILNGSKPIEIRKHFPDKWANHEIALYATKPVGSLVGKAEVESVTRGQPAEIWSCFESKLGCSKLDFDAYVGDAEEIAAIRLRNVCAYHHPVRLDKMASLLGEALIPPQSYFGFNSDRSKNWLKAVYLANLSRRKAELLSDSKFKS